MDIWTLLLLAVGLAMDAFAVSICKGLALGTSGENRKVAEKQGRRKPSGDQKGNEVCPRTSFSLRNCLIVGIWFGCFQAVMPMIGYLLGSRFETYVNTFASWIAFGLLALIGGNMLREAIAGEEETENASLAWKEMLVLAIATSIDAMAVGITFACVPVVLGSGWSALGNTAAACLIIGVITCAISMAGVRIGHIFGSCYKKKAELAGGAILILLGIKILLEHFGIL